MLKPLTTVVRKVRSVAWASGAPGVGRVGRDLASVVLGGRRSLIFHYEGLASAHKQPSHCWDSAGPGAVVPTDSTFDVGGGINRFNFVDHPLDAVILADSLQALLLDANTRARKKRVVHGASFLPVLEG